MSWIFSVVSSSSPWSCWGGVFTFRGTLGNVEAFFKATFLVWLESLAKVCWGMIACSSKLCFSANHFSSSSFCRISCSTSSSLCNFNFSSLSCSSCIFLSSSFSLWERDNSDFCLCFSSLSIRSWSCSICHFWKSVNLAFSWVLFVSINCCLLSCLCFSAFAFSLLRFGAMLL